MPTISVIVLNWNGKKYLDDCFSSIFSQTEQADEVIFVDNASTDGSIGLVNTKFPQVEIIANKQNYGFAKGMNMGISKAKSDFVFILNNDTKLDNDCIKNLKEAISSNPMAGMFSPKIVYYDTQKVDTCGLTMSRALVSKDAKKDNGKIICPCGGAAVYNRKMLEENKLPNGDYFDSDYFIYVEDFDLGLRCFMAGWKCKHIPTALVHHIHSATMKGSDKAIWVGQRNRLFTIEKNFTFTELCLHAPFTLLYNILFIIKYCVLLKPALAFKPLLSYLRDNIKFDIMNKSTHIHFCRKVGYSAIRDKVCDIL